MDVDDFVSTLFRLAYIEYWIYFLY